jgi:GrpB-like predicted nucleotidyltransferase (UPF0157 family)
VPQQPVEVVADDLAWPRRLAELGARLRTALRDVALRIDHIGSTAVPGLAAKPVIDVQISVAALEPVDPFRIPLERLGFVDRAGNPERTKRYFREPPGSPHTHIHVRRAGSSSEQHALLFRNHLRADPAAAAQYAAVKRELAGRHGHDRLAYTDAKDPHVWALVRRADAWAQEKGWQPGPSDA